MNRKESMKDKIKLHVALTVSKDKSTMYIDGKPVLGLSNNKEHSATANVYLSDKEYVSSHD